MSERLEIQAYIPCTCAHGNHRNLVEMTEQQDTIDEYKNLLQNKGLNQRNALHITINTLINNFSLEEKISALKL
jgi:hypothetical protein